MSDFRPAPKASCHTPKIPILRRKQTRRPLPQFFSSLLMLYLMLWITTSHMVIPAGLHYQFSFDALTTSITSGIWNDYYYVFWIWLTAAGPLMAVVFLLLTAVVFVFCVS